MRLENPNLIIGNFVEFLNECVFPDHVCVYWVRTEKPTIRFISKAIF